MLEVVICERFSWTREQYLDQPQFFLDLIIQKIKVDAQKEENELKKIKK
jgi:hypothetical protein